MGSEGHKARATSVGGAALRDKQASKQCSPSIGGAESKVRRIEEELF